MQTSHQRKGGKGSMQKPAVKTLKKIITACWEQKRDFYFLEKGIQLP